MNTIREALDSILYSGKDLGDLSRELPCGWLNNLVTLADIALGESGISEPTPRDNAKALVYAYASELRREHEYDDAVYIDSVIINDGDGISYNIMIVNGEIDEAYIMQPSEFNPLDDLEY